MPSAWWFPCSLSTLEVWRSVSVTCSSRAIAASSGGHLQILPYPPSQSPGWVRECGRERAAAPWHIASSFLLTWHCIVPDPSAVTRCNVVMKRESFTVPSNMVRLWSSTTLLWIKWLKIVVWVKEWTTPEQPQWLCQDVQDLEQSYGFQESVMLVK